MSRFADIFIALCTLVVAASIGTVLRFQVGLELRDAFYIALGLACVFLVLQFWSGRGRDRQRASDLDVLSERLDAVRGELDGFGRRLAMIEGGLSRRVREDLDPLVAEAEAMGSLLRQVTETVADLDIRVQQLSAVGSNALAGAEAEASEPPQSQGAPGEAPRAAPRRSQRPAPAAVPPAMLVPMRFSGLGEKGFLELVRRAIEGNRIDVFLQPVVSLPQRKVLHYECFTRLRTEDGETIYPTDYTQIAEKAGIMPALDIQILQRAIHLLRRLATRSRELGIFCNVSPVSLASPAFFKDATAFLDQNRAFADVLIFEVSQEATKAMGSVEFDALKTLAEMGFRFSLDQVTDTKSNLALLQARGFRFAKVSAERLLDKQSALTADIHPADLASHFSRFGLDLIVDHVESEAQVVDLLDFDLKFGQGFVFSPPRPVRSEMMQGFDGSDETAARAKSEPAAPARGVAPDRLTASGLSGGGRNGPAAPGASPQTREQRPRLAVVPEQQRRGPLGRAIAARQ